MAFIDPGSNISGIQEIKQLLSQNYILYFV